MTTIKIGMKDEYCCRETEYRLYTCNNVSNQALLKVHKLSKDKTIDVGITDPFPNELELKNNFEYITEEEYNELDRKKLGFRFVNISCEK